MLMSNLLKAQDDYHELSLANNIMESDIETQVYGRDSPSLNGGWVTDELNAEISQVEDDDEKINILQFTPSRLLKKGQFEVQLFNNLYTQTSYRDGNRDEVELDTRDTYFSAIFYTLIGVSKNKRVNIGFDLNLKSVLIDSTKGSPLQVFKFQNSSFSRTAITSLGPKIKILPFKSVPDFSIQSAFWIPIADDLESIKEVSDYPWMDYHMYTWWNQFFYDKTFGSNWQLFTEADLLFRLKTSNGNIPSHLDIPISAFLSWFPGKKSTFYYMIQYSPRFQLEKSYVEGESGMQEVSVETFDYISDFAHTGLGFKFQVSKKINFETSATYFFTSLNGGAGYTFNLGIRYIH